MASETKRKVVDCFGKEYSSLKAMCEAYHISYGTYCKRRYRGKTFEEALTVPVKKYSPSIIVSGYKFVLPCGLNAEVISVKGKSALIRAEDGKEWRSNKSNIIKGETGHPDLRRNRKSTFMGFETQFSASINNKAFYECRCLKCGAYEVFTPQQMIEHAREHNIQVTSQ